MVASQISMARAPRELTLAPVLIHSLGGWVAKGYAGTRDRAVYHLLRRKLNILIVKLAV